MFTQEGAQAPKNLLPFVIMALSSGQRTDKDITEQYGLIFMRGWQFWSIVKKGESLRRKMDYMVKKGLVLKVKICQHGNAYEHLYSLTHEGREKARELGFLEAPTLKKQVKGGSLFSIFKR